MKKNSIQKIMGSDALWSAASVAWRSLNVLLVNKIVAVFFGPAGIALFAHLLNLFGIFNIIPSEGVNRGLVKFAASPEMSESEKSAYFMAGWAVTSGVFLLISIFILFWKTELLQTFGAGGADLSLFWFLVFVYMHLLNSLLLFFYLGKQKTKAFSVLVCVGSALAIFTTYFGARYGLGIALTGFMAGRGLNFLFTWAYFKKTDKLPFIKTKWSVLWEKALAYRGFLLMALSSILLDKAIEFFVRGYSISRFSLDDTGIWQAGVQLSERYTMLFSSLLSILYYPSVSRFCDMPNELHKTLRKAFAYSVPSLLLGLGGLWLLKKPLFILFFDESFLLQANLFDYLLAGDFFKLLSYLLGLVLLAKQKTAAFIVLQSLPAAAYLLCLPPLLEARGIFAFNDAHLIRYLLYFVLLAGYFWFVGRAGRK